MRTCTPWTVFNLAAQRFECQRCGETCGSPLPCSVDMLSKLSKAFGAEHRGCKERAPTEATGASDQSVK